MITPNMMEIEGCSYQTAEILKREFCAAINRSPELKAEFETRMQEVEIAFLQMILYGKQP